MRLIAIDWSGAERGARKRIWLAEVRDGHLIRLEGGRTTITLEPGVAYCFRAFYSMITDIVRGTWSGFIQRYNGPLLGSATDLHAFLFGTERSLLTRYCRRSRSP